MDKRYMDKTTFAAFWARLLDMLRTRVAKVNGRKPDPTGNVSLTAADVGARPATWTPTAAEVGARPATWTPTAQEVGARPDDWMPTAENVGAIPTVGGAAEGHVPVFDQNGNLASSGVNFWAYHHLYCNLQGTTLYITTL